MHFFYFLQFTSGRKSWNSLHVNTTESSAIYLVSKLHPKRHDIWLKLNLPSSRLDFEPCCFLTTVSMFSCCSEGGWAIADSELFYLRTRLQHPSLITLKYKITEISFAAVSRHFFFSVYLFPGFEFRRSTGGPSSNCEMIILRNNSRGGIVRVWIGISTTAQRIKNFVKLSMKIPHLTCTAYHLLSDRLLSWKEPILASCPFRGFPRT